MRPPRFGIILHPMLAMLLLLAPPQDIAATARELTRAEVPCRPSRDSADITVCGRREADRRYRITFVTPDVRDSVPRERGALLEDKMPGCGRVGGIMTGCGFAGATVTRTFGGPGAATSVTTRKQAP